MAPWEHLGTSWEQQDGLEGVWNRIFIDFGFTLGPHFESFFGTEAWKFNFLSGLFPAQFVYRFVIRNLVAWGS